MTHADSSLVPTDIRTKDEFYEFLQEQLASLIEDTRSWVSNLAQISSLLYHAYLTSPLYGLHKDKAYSPVVNWVGFYVQDLSPGASPDSPLGLGPFHGRPACMQIRIQAGKGVCADAYIKGEAVVVPDVDQYPGHLACDGDSKSEIVLPLSIPSGDGSLRKVGVFDLDATVVGTYDDADRRGLQGLLDIVVKGSDWP